MTLSKIGTATFSQNLGKSISNPISIHSNSAEIGILLDGNWVCGDVVKEFNEQGKVQKFWSFEVVFNTYEFNDTIVINKEHVHITLPFLLAIFFRIMKQKSENEHNGKISAAIISIPFWFSSYKRSQIVDAGTIAGFDNVQLINENTASAYYAYTSGLSPPSQTMVIISENSTVVDISPYQPK